LIKKIHSTTHHSHTLLEDIARASGSYLTIINNPDGDEIFIVTDYRWGEYLGYIDVEYDPQGKLFMKALQSILSAQLHYNLIVRN